MSKTLRTDQITSELSGTAFFGGQGRRPNSEPSEHESQPTSIDPTLLSHQPVSSQIDSSVDQAVDRSVDQGGSLSTEQSTAPGGYVGRPKAFYITTRVDEQLDEAVRYFQQAHGLKKVDRSMIVNALLDNEEQWTEESLDRLLRRVIDQLTSRLTGR